MVKKTRTPDASQEAEAPRSSTVKDSAQQIWLAGLGAFTKAQQEGGKLFDALVKEGVGMQRKTQSAAEDKISEATGKMASMATDISSKAAGRWDKLENIFEDRVAKALEKLGAPSANDIEHLRQRIDALQKSVQELSATMAPKSPVARPVSATPAARPPTRAGAKPQATPVKKAVAKPAAKPATKPVARRAARKSPGAAKG